VIFQVNKKLGKGLASAKETIGALIPWMCMTVTRQTKMFPFRLIESATDKTMGKLSKARKKADQVRPFTVLFTAAVS